MRGHNYRSGLAAVAVVLLCALLVGTNAQGAEVTARQVVPDQALQAKAEGAIRELFSPYPPVKQAEQTTVARKLLARAAQTKDDAAGRYVLLREAKDLAAKAGDVETALEAADSLGRVFLVDAATMKLDVMRKALQGSTPAGAAKIVELALRMAEECWVSGDTAAGGKALAAAESAARTVDKSVAGVVQARVAASRKVQQERGKYDVATARLKKNPQDAEASGIAGRFACLFEGDWEKGLSLLAKGPEGGMKAAAVLDLGQPADAGQQVAAGNAWYALAKPETGVARRSLLGRAGRWYKQAIPSLSGLNKGVIEKRMVELDAEAAASPAAALPANLLSQRLNDFAEWTPNRGKWERTAGGGLHGEGDSEILFNHEMPGDIVLTFRIKIMSGIRPRVGFDGTDIVLANEAYSKGFHVIGRDDIKSNPFPYEYDRDYKCLMRFAGDEYEITMDGKTLAQGKRKPCKSMKLKISAGDGWSKGVVEYSMFSAEPVAGR